MSTESTIDPCATSRGCGRGHGDCDGCGTPLECAEWRSGICDGCWQARDESGGE